MLGVAAATRTFTFARTSAPARAGRRSVWPSPAVLDDDVASSDVPEIDEGSPEPITERLGAAEREYSDAGDLVRLLPRECHWCHKPCQGADEKGPTLHHPPRRCRPTYSCASPVVVFVKPNAYWAAGRHWMT